MPGVGLPLLPVWQLRPLRRRDQGVGVDPEEGEVLGAVVVPQLGEQAGLLHWRLCAPAP